MTGASVVPVQRPWSIQRLRSKANANAEVHFGVQFVQKQNPDKFLVLIRCPVILCHAKLTQIVNRVAVDLGESVLKLFLNPWAK
jgi:hypothetical protein